MKSENGLAIFVSWLRRKPHILNVLLFSLTFLFTLVIGLQFHITFYAIAIPGVQNLFQLIAARPASLLWGLPYSLSLMAILLVHELGHFMACRRHHIRATWPYFIPAPTLVGTFGAFIKIQSPFPSKKALFDVGVAGPVAGFFVALPIIAIGIHHSRIIEAQTLEAGITLGEPLVFQLFTLLVKGPLPADQDILIHPIAFAGWFGLLATAFNLFPIGQLDGGHILYSLLGKKSRHVALAAIAAIVLLGIFFWQGWLFWALIVTFIGLRHPPIYEDEVIDRRRKVWAAVALIIFILSFTPAPISF